MNNRYSKNPASFRDPDAFIFTDQNGKTYRQLNHTYQSNYEMLMNSGLYQKLVSSGKLISHQEINDAVFDNNSSYKTILPEQLAFISYPYEWCFEQLQDSALLTLEILKISLDHGMILKDATPFNTQLHKGSMVFIDTCSFEKYDEGKLWIGYRQFCETFLAPLSLMHYKDASLNNLLIIYPDGIPLALAQKLLPIQSYFNIGVLLHIHFQAGYPKRKSKSKNPKMLKRNLFALIDNLKNTVKNFKPRYRESAWSHYYTESTDEKYLQSKRKIVAELLQKIKTQSAVDLGANEGIFSEILEWSNGRVISADSDAHCISNLYRSIKGNARSAIFPIVSDLSAPFGSVGWDNNERNSFIQRAKSELVVALALIHHLVIGKNISLQMVAGLFSTLGENLIIEFIPKTDSKVEIMLENRKDIFDVYNEMEFENAFSEYFTLVDKMNVDGSERMIYLYRKTT